MGFIGENGEGKSTTIKVIMDLVKKDAGMVTVLGKESCKRLFQRNEDETVNTHHMLH